MGYTPTKYITNSIGVDKFGIDIETKAEQSKLKLLTPGESVKPILNYPEDSSVIFVPKGYSYSKLDDLFLVKRTELVPKLNNELPPVINDLRSVINVKTIYNNKDLMNRIETFNKVLSRKIKTLK